MSQRIDKDLRGRKAKFPAVRGNRFGRGRTKYRGASHKIQQLKQEAQGDESTTNSENSEGSPLYNEINWEENLECDANLVDEFAPRVQIKTEFPVIEQNVPLNESFKLKIENVSEIIDVDVSGLTEGADIFVQVKFTNDKTKWLSATVLEMDELDQEAFIKYTEGNPPPPNEWLNVSSNRISRIRPASLEKEKDEPIEAQVLPLSRIKTEVGVVLPFKIKTEVEDMDDIIPPKIKIEPSSPPFPPIPLCPEDPEDVKIAELVKRHTTAFFPIKIEEDEDLEVVPARTRGGHRRRGGHSSAPARTRGGHTSAPARTRGGHTSAPARTRGGHASAPARKRGGWMRNRSLQHKPHFGHSKFVEGEKVLAKWSDYRMQKFPAVIKTIYSGGKYDVLFYDGFEKTINEEHLFKTTEEEFTKYQHMNPSEADSFHHMDLGSKEARRQRKRKTFDDYVFSRDVKTKKRVMKSGERFGLSRKIGFFPKGGKVVVGKDEGGEESDKPLRQKRKRRRTRFGNKKDNSMGKLHMLDIHRASESPVSNETENFYGFDTILEPDESEPLLTPPPAPAPTPAPALAPALAPTPAPPVQTITETPPEPIVVKRIDSIDARWQPNELQEYKPIDINRGGTIRKSLVVPDNNLPPGWSKHAIVSTTNNIWEVILLSPDGYQIANSEELKHYFEAVMPNGGHPPSTLDFLADFNVLAELASKQKEVPLPPVTPSPRPRRGGRGARRGGRGYFSGRGRSPGLKTLLPKPRYEQVPIESTPPQTIPTTPENEFRCPKEGCDKKFRKESLLQMHIKHYHRELSSLVRSVPNMVDLACARSESVNSDFPKLPPSAVKKMLPRSFSSSPSIPEDSGQRMDQFLESPLSSTPSTSRILERTPSTESSSLKRSLVDEKRSTIKTMLPIRFHKSLESKSNIESEDAESEDDYIEQKKNGSRIFKPGKLKKCSNKFVTELYPEEGTPSLGGEVLDNGVVLERLRSEEFINCLCGFREEDGLMIQCDICMCWQHGLCSGIENESDVPERYVCRICLSPLRVRSSKKYSYAQQYLTQGKLPSFKYRTRNDKEMSHKEMILKRSFELTGGLLEIKNIERSLAAKINIAEQADHPKLYLWAKNWENVESKSNIIKPKEEVNDNNIEGQPQIGTERLGPEPEAPIDLEECRIRLLDHVDDCYSQIDDRLTSIQTQIAALESLDPDLSSNSVSDKVTKQSIQMLIRDLDTLHKLAAIS